MPRWLHRLAPLDRALVLVLVPLWVVCFGLAVRTQIEGWAGAFLGVSLEDARGYPTFTGRVGGFHPSNLLEEAGLREGDVLVRMGGADLRGVGTTLGVLNRSAQEGSQDRVAVVYERGGERHETSLPLVSISILRPWLATSFAFAATGLFLILRARPTPAVRAYFHSALAIAFSVCAFGGSRELFSASFGIQGAAGFFVFPLLLRFGSLFPDSPPESRWQRTWPWLFASYGLWFSMTFVNSLEFEAALNGTIALAGAVMLVQSARRSCRRGPIARRQLRWVLVGTYCALLPLALAGALTAIEPSFNWLMPLSFWAVAVFPVSLVVSIVRFNLFDVDRILSATASYNILAVLLVAAALVGVPRVIDAAAPIVGIDPGAGQIVLSIALAALLVPAHRRLRPQIDRVFFKERYALDQGVAGLLPTLSACADARELTESAGRELHRLLRPEACVVYARVEESYAPVFAEGRAVPSAFAADSPLVGTLRARREPLSLSAAGRRPDEAALGPFDRAALETLGAEVVVPVRQGDALPAFLCLGPKRSGDVYTSTDLSLLAAVAETVSQQLQRFDQDAVIRAGREMQESLRRYVPGAVAEQLAGGAELRSGEREVTVLFVDIRGYTGFAESRRAEEIFSTVNRYTETVSQIVARHAGSVVEFNGDGMMAVFGAPRELAHKERAAVEAGREIVTSVGALRAEGAQLSVGVGVATGEAFVGNIRAVDRMIWSAIGNTTNLAARLQGLTRELDAAVVIDAVTWKRARAACADFEQRLAAPIRGRRETQDVYVLALRSDAEGPSA